MFVQIIQGHVRDAEQLKAALDQWVRDLSPGAEGWLRSTGGVTDDGDFIGLACFTDETSARRSSDRPEQGQWWRQASAVFDGKVTFHEAYNAVTENAGDPNAAQFVQIVQGQGHDRIRGLRLLVAEAEEWARSRPEVLGTTACTYGDGEYTVAVYFVNERDARSGEVKQLPAKLAEELAEMRQLQVRGPNYLDLHTPWIAAPRSG